jgi:hypothetical protein
MLLTLSDCGLSITIKPDVQPLHITPNFSEETNLLIMLNMYLLFRWDYDCVARNYLKLLFR